MMPFRSYLIHLFAYTGVIISVVAGFNLLVDPYDMFDLVRIKGFNKLKPAVSSHARMIKAHKIRIIRPDAIILGSSRSETGLDPDYPGWRSDTENPFNLSLHSANIYEVYRYLQHAHSIHPIKQAVIGLDFFMFNVNKDVEKDFEQERLEPAGFIPVGWCRDIFNALFTFDALTASFETIRSQYDHSVTRYRSNGFPDDSGKWRAIQSKGGHRQAAINNERYTLFSRDSFPFFSLYDEERFNDSATLSVFTEIVRFSKKNDIDLRLFISPIHARKLALINEIGLWGDFEQWKRSLVVILESEGLATPLWDFTTLNRITMEPFPELGDTDSRMKWYWESSHYTKGAGKLLLDTVFEQRVHGTCYPENFGVVLTSKNIDNWMNVISEQIEKYKNDHPVNMREIHRMIEETHDKRETLFAENKQLKPKRKFEPTPSPHD